MIILQTERLILRDFCEDDLDQIYCLVYADPQVKDTWSTVTGTPEELKKRFAQRYIRPGETFGLKAIVLKESGTLGKSGALEESAPFEANGGLIGLMGFQVHEPAEGQEIYYLLSKETPQRTVNHDPTCLEVELTYALGKAYWKKGYAAEMGRAMLAYGFENLGIGRIIQGVLATNANSIGLMRRLGFRIEEGLYPENVVGILDKAGYSRI